MLVFLEAIQNLSVDKLWIMSNTCYVQIWRFCVVFAMAIGTVGMEFCFLK